MAATRSSSRCPNRPWRATSCAARRAWPRRRGAGGAGDLGGSRMSVWKLIAVALSREGRDPSGLRGQVFWPSRARSSASSLAARSGLAWAEPSVVQVRALTHTQDAGRRQPARPGRRPHPSAAVSALWSSCACRSPRRCWRSGGSRSPHARAAYADRLPASIRDRRGTRRRDQRCSRAASRTACRSWRRS